MPRPSVKKISWKKAGVASGRVRVRDQVELYTARDIVSIDRGLLDWPDRALEIMRAFDCPVSFEFRVWLHFLRHVVYHPVRRGLYGCWILDDARRPSCIFGGVDYSIPLDQAPALLVFDGVPSAVTRFLELMDFYWRTCLADGLVFRLRDDVDELGCWHGMTVVCAVSAQYSSLRSALPGFVETLNDEAFAALELAGYGSLMGLRHDPGSDDLFIIFGPLYFVNSRCGYCVRFGDRVDTNRVSLYGLSAEGTFVRDDVRGFEQFLLKGKVLGNYLTEPRRVRWLVGEVFSVDYEGKIIDCRCLQCRARSL